MILYHGSKAIIESPEIRIQKYNKDFYFGFYCTLLPEQAVRWAARFDGVGYLNVYCYTPEGETVCGHVRGMAGFYRIVPFGVSA